MHQMPPWTFSHLDGFTTCPKQHYHLRVARDVKEPPQDYQKWGDDVHAALEYRIKDGTPLPEKMAQWEGLVKKIEAMPGVKHTEMKMALNADFQPVDWKDPTAWTRGKADLTIVSNSSAAVLDYKTGKRKLTDQLYLYAAYTFAYFPEVEVVHSGFVWLKDKRIDKETIHRSEVPVLWNKFLPTYNKLKSAFERDSWPPRPSGLCKAHCAVTQCPYNGKRGGM